MPGSEPRAVNHLVTPYYSGDVWHFQTKRVLERLNTVRCAIRLRFPLFMLLIAGLTAASTAVWPDVVAAQNGVTGRVVDSGGEALSGVSVMMMPESGGAATMTHYRRRRHLSLRQRERRHVSNRFRARAVRCHASKQRSCPTVQQCLATWRCRPVGPATAMWSLPGCLLSRSVPGRSSTPRGGRFHARGWSWYFRPANWDIRPDPGSTNFRAVAHADAEGRFSVFAPVESNVPLTASDTGFAPVTQMVSGSGAGLIVFRLPHLGSAGQAENYERFPRGCLCPSNLITRPD